MYAYRFVLRDLGWQSQCVCLTDGCQRLNTYARPVQNINDASSTSYWQSPDLVPLVNVSLDMLYEQEVSSVTLSFNTPVPKAMVLFRSADAVSWKAYNVRLSS